MKVYCISDNVDTQMGLRLAGIEGVVLHDRDLVLECLEKLIKDDNIAIVLMTTKIVNLCPDVVSMNSFVFSQFFLLKLDEIKS